MAITKDDLENRFAYHKPPNESVASLHQAVRDVCLATALAIHRATPPGREQALAITKLEEAMMWANAAIARSPERPSP